MMASDIPEREVIASSIYGTSTIEGGTLTEDETRSAIDLDPAQVQEIEQRRVLNIKVAYERARDAALDPGWKMSVDFMTEVHGLITHDLPHADNRPGLIGDNPKGRVIQIGRPRHGRRFSTTSRAATSPARTAVPPAPAAARRWRARR